LIDAENKAKETALEAENKRHLENMRGCCKKP
jgi:hypothetical protein